MIQENRTAVIISLLRHSSINCQVLQLHVDINLLLRLQSLEVVEILEVKLRDPDIFKIVECRMVIHDLILHVQFFLHSKKHNAKIMVT